jgi:single-strand DNA-binding protein
MNSCILMATIVRAPELRYTQDNQTPVTHMMVEFEGSKPEEKSTLRVTGWGNLATEMQESYSEGERVIIEGRLSMSTLDRQEGFKEKRAELVASKIYRLDGTVTETVPTSSKETSPKSDRPKSSKAAQPKTTVAESIDKDDYEDYATATAGKSKSTSAEENLDEIPF